MEEVEEMWQQHPLFPWRSFLEKYENVPDKAIVYSDDSGVKIDMRTIRRHLLPGKWFNQDIIQPWLNWVQIHTRETTKGKEVHVANTYLFHKIEQAYNDNIKAQKEPDDESKKQKYENTLKEIDRWFKNKTRPDKIYCPVNKNGHWYFVVVVIDWAAKTDIYIEVNDSFHEKREKESSMILWWTEQFVLKQDDVTSVGNTKIMYRVGRRNANKALSPNEIVDKTYELQQDNHTCGSCMLLGIFKHVKESINNVCDQKREKVEKMNLSIEEVGWFHSFWSKTIINHSNFEDAASQEGKEPSQDKSTSKQWEDKDNFVQIYDSDDEAGVNPDKKQSPKQGVDSRKAAPTGAAAGAAGGRSTQAASTSSNNESKSSDQMDAEKLDITRLGTLALDILKDVSDKRRRFTECQMHDKNPTESEGHVSETDAEDCRRTPPPAQERNVRRKTPPPAQERKVSRKSDRRRRFVSRQKMQQLAALKLLIDGQSFPVLSETNDDEFTL